MRSRSQDQKIAQKRLQMVTKQLYGSSSGQQRMVTKGQTTPDRRSDSLGNNAYSFSSHLSSTTPKISSDASYLKRDLIKIMVLSTIAITAQMLIYLGIRQGLINL